MPAQILLQGKLLGIDEFLLASPAPQSDSLFEARSVWVTLLGEVLPRALLMELQLPPLMLGASGSEFLLILPDDEKNAAAMSFLARASDAIKRATAGLLRLVWSSTENLGDWTVVRKRLHEQVRENSPANAPDFFEPFPESAGEPEIPIPDLRDAQAVAWSFDFPALLAAEGGTHRWDLTRQASATNINVLRHRASNQEGPLDAAKLAGTSKGRPMWGVLRGEVDDFKMRLRRLHSVEEYVHLLLLYKQFFIGEIELLCSHGDYFQRVTVISTGASEFALYGAWDALARMAQELQRVFTRFAEENLKELPGGEAKSVTMALAIAEPGAGLAATYESCGRDLAVAQAADKDCLFLMGKILEWKQLQDAADLKDAIVRLDEEFKSGRQFIDQLRALYRKVESPERLDEDRLRARAARFQRRFARVATRREREFQKLRAHLMKELAGRSNRGRLKLRPEGLVALEWARYTEEHTNG